MTNQDYLNSRLHITYDCFKNWKVSFIKEVSQAALMEVLPLYIDKFEYAKLYCVDSSGKFLQLNIIGKYDVVMKVYYWRDWVENEPGGWFVPSGSHYSAKASKDIVQRIDDLFNFKK